MRIRSWLLLGVGYLAGTKAGREKFEELKNAVQDLASSDVAAEAINKVRGNLGLAQSAQREAGRNGKSGGDGSPSGWQQEEGAWVPDSAETRSDDRGGQADSRGETDGDESKRGDTTAEA
ncbi:MAG: hypothetical protein GEU74_07690 [Nitriliruptorales bacterium]|nr:hypothetical protein [Nitriliruptorales bacterium]